MKSRSASQRPTVGEADADQAAARLAQLQRRYRVLSACNHAMIHSVSEDELLTDICRALVEVGGYRLAWVGYSDATVGSAWGAGPLDSVELGWTHAHGDQTPAVRAMRLTSTQVVRDLGDGRWNMEWRARAREKKWE